LRLRRIGGGRRRRAVVLAGAASALAALFLAGNGCYYAQVAFGQARVLFGREKIEDALATNHSLRPDERAKLALVPEIRRFAHEEIGLADNGSYRTFYDTGEKPISWNVSACAKTSFTPYLWTFPFVGAAPYKGFFDLEDARAQARELAALGLDTEVREVSAYSTLGWFDDPVFRRMLAYDVGDLASTLIHELTHATVFRAGDADFNESCATFVGNEGGLAFLAARFGPESAEVRRARDEKHDEALFTDFIDRLYARLDRLYRGPGTDEEKLAAREVVFEEAKRELAAERKKSFATDAYAGFEQRKLDNCVILGYRAYHTDLAAFADVFELTGRDWKKTIAVFKEAAAARSPRGFLADWRVAARERRAALATATHEPENAAGAMTEH
jgi:predicted aminopeptidase